MVDKIWYNMEELIGGSEERVLIETYWNVNFCYVQFVFSILGINRNILECKYVCWKSCAYVARVLIETYWNVN